jgi:predicted transglutaminase-like cysteine proteinase
MVACFRLLPAAALTLALFALFVLCAEPAGAAGAGAGNTNVAARPQNPPPRTAQSSSAHTAQDSSGRIAQGSSGRTAQGSSADTAQGPPARSGQNPPATVAADNDWIAEDSGPRAPGELRLHGYVLRPAENEEAKSLQSAWDRIMREHDQERFFKPHPNFDKQRLAQWQKLAAKMPGLSPEDALRHINGFFNGWPSIKDIDAYGKEEYWATPEEFVRSNGGDCEDYAVIKYMALRNFGVPAENMWMLLVYDKGRATYHAVLAVYAGERLFMLDNLSQPSYLLIPEAVFLKTFTPLVAVNEKGIRFITPENPEDAVQADGQAVGDRRHTAR